MPFFDYVCDNGHAVHDVLASSRPAQCATCGAPTQMLWGKSAMVTAVTWPGGKTFENLGHEPKTFYAPSELAQYCKEHRIEPFVRHVPVPGSDKSPHTTRWSSMSRETLEGATAMLTRVSTSGTDDPPNYIREMTVTITEGR